MKEELLERVREWLAIDPDAHDRATIEHLLAQRDESEIRRRFDEPLSFGTAGLRGPEMAGPAGMNRCTVRRATQGVVAWLEDIKMDSGRGVVVGRDARHGSEVFNDEVVGVLLGAGVRVFEMPRPLPTPLTAYALRALGAAAGIMITASHNPPADNGFKLYGADGSQIIAPHDDIVESHARNAGPAAWAERTSERYQLVDEGLINGYLEHMARRFGVVQSELPIAYTPLFGVGGATMLELLFRSGFSRVTPVQEQFQADPFFPGLPFPNPEEAGVLDAGIACADRVGAILLIANDPDADRLGAAARHVDGSWRTLRGDEIGWLLGAGAIEAARDDDVVASSIVSSSMLEEMAARAQVTHVTTLTGFKWISKAAPGRRLTFGYEEALGYAVDPCVADKDGLSAALALVRLAHDLSQHDQTLLDRLDELETLYGVHAGTQISLRVSPPQGREALNGVMRRIRAVPPVALGGLKLSDVVDLEAGWRDLAPTSGLMWRLGEMGRVIVRPSGTEPKLKAYVEVIGPASTQDLAGDRARCFERLQNIRRDLEILLALDHED